MNGTETIDARRLLSLFLGLRGLAPDLNAWSEEQFANNPPRLLRLRQLMGLFKAFRIPWDPVGFSQGRFIDRKKSHHPGLIAVLSLEMTELGISNHEIHAHSLAGGFRLLLDYRTRVGSVLDFWGGVMEASGAYLYAYKKGRELNETLERTVGSIDDALARFISPDGKSFTIRELVDRFGYPEDDLSDVDEDWF
jgi:hypothetical protein